MGLSVQEFFAGLAALSIAPLIMLARDAINAPSDEEVWADHPECALLVFIIVCVALQFLLK